MSAWKIDRNGKGEKSTIRVSNSTIPVAFTMTQQEARDLINGLAHVTLMPPRESSTGSQA